MPTLMSSQLPPLERWVKFELNGSNGRNAPCGNRWLRHSLTAPAQVDLGPGGEGVEYQWMVKSEGGGLFSLQANNGHSYDRFLMVSGHGVVVGRNTPGFSTWKWSGLDAGTLRSGHSNMLSNAGKCQGVLTFVSTPTNLPTEWNWELVPNAHWVTPASGPGHVTPEGYTEVNEATPEHHNEPYRSEHRASDDWWVILVVVIGVLVALGIFFALLRRRQKRLGQ